MIETTVTFYASFRSTVEWLKLSNLTLSKIMVHHPATVTVKASTIPSCMQPNEHVIQNFFKRRTCNPTCWDANQHGEVLKNRYRSFDHLQAACQHHERWSSHNCDGIARLQTLRSLVTLCWTQLVQPLTEINHSKVCSNTLPYCRMNTQLCYHQLSPSSNNGYMSNNVLPSQHAFVISQNIQSNICLARTTLLPVYINPVITHLLQMANDLMEHIEKIHFQFKSKSRWIRCF